MASTAPVRLRWGLERNVYTPQTPEGRAQAVFTFTNLGAQALPAQGWALYFNCISGVVTGELASPFTLDHLSGTWFRLRPRAGFTGLGAGQTLNVAYLQPEALARPDKAPTGPYLVFDDAPSVGRPIADYERLPLTQPEQLDKGPNDPQPVITPADLFRRNQRIQPLPASSLPPVFPSPWRFERLAGQLTWTAMPAIQAAPGLHEQAAFASALLAPHFKPNGAPDTDHPLHLVLATVPGQTSNEAYELRVSPSAGVTLRAPSSAGIHQGLQSLRQLLPLAARPGQGVSLQALHITDAPRFAYRGLMLDVARNFHDKASVLRLLDLMARFKLNKFHFHLTDDEGWRLAIPGLPELTSVAARRGHTLDSR
jgi:hexosaminidase